MIIRSLGLYFDDLFIPQKHGDGIHLSGITAVIMYIAIIFTVLNLLSVIVDHFDKRNNEFSYQLFAKITKVCGWISFLVSIIWALILESF